MISSSAADARPINCKSNVVPLAITRTNGPWTHTSDDSHIYQLSLVLATATMSFCCFVFFYCAGTYRRGLTCGAPTRRRWFSRLYSSSVSFNEKYVTSFIAKRQSPKTLKKKRSKIICVFLATPLNGGCNTPRDITALHAVPIEEVTGASLSSVSQGGKKKPSSQDWQQHLQQPPCCWRFSAP